ncbi:MAG: SRPBCC domain-containing protein [Thermoplasmata archaeon]
MDFNGEFRLSSNKDNTLKRLSDFEGIVSCLPGIESYEKNGDEYTCRLKLDASSMKTSYLNTISGKMSVNYAGINGNSLDVNGKGRVAGSSIKIALHVDVDDDGEGTLIKWSVSVDYGLMSKLIGKEKLQIATQENIDKSIKCLENKLV